MRTKETHRVMRRLRRRSRLQPLRHPLAFWLIPFGQLLERLEKLRRVPALVRLYGEREVQVDSNKMMQRGE